MLDEADPARDQALVDDDAVVPEPEVVEPDAVETVDAVGDADVVADESPVVVPAGRRRRPSRFDRPKPPHDWRWAVAGTGRVLISTGILMFGFVAYQLWGTALQTAAAQNKLENEFEEMVESMSTLPFPGSTTASTGSTAPGDTTGPVATGPDATNPLGTIGPDGPATGTTLPGQTTVPGDTTPTGSSVPASVDPGVTAPTSPIPPPEPLQLIGRLQIPSIGADDYIVQGVTARALKKGPGHFPETPLPGQLGNSAIAGHRTTYGAPFGEIDEVQPGDDIIAEIPGAGTYYYVVTRIEIVDPSDGYAMAVGTLDPSKATLSLVSCHPEYTTQQRIVVFADLDPTRSNIVTQPTEPLPADTSGELPSEEVPATNAPDTTPAPEPTTPATEAPAATTPASEASAAPAGLLSGAGSKRVVIPAATYQDGTSEEGEDAFSAGWFSDDGAWPHVAVWGLLLTTISLGAYWVSRKTRRNWIGALVGIAPFIVTLYFFYENVNRLLPPAL